MQEKPYICAMALIEVNNQFLGVSRKHDHTDIGMAGGKLDPGETHEQAAVREVLEETGYVIELLDDEPFRHTHLGYDVLTYRARIVGGEYMQNVNAQETGVVGWFDKQTILNGSFGKYHELSFKHFGY